MNTYTEITYPMLHAAFASIDTYTFTMKVKDILAIYYVAVRGKDLEQGSVQRVLSRNRIFEIRDYVLAGNSFFNSFILNWTDHNYLPKINTTDLTLSLNLVPSSAQVIDGQHRLEGLKSAFEVDSDIGETNIVVTLCIGLTTKEAAQIFLNINTEQKPVPKSLMYDLFGEVINDDEHSINRATDIARELNDDVGSPLYKLIKFPGAPRGVGVIELSTFVSALQDSLKKDGVFNQYKINEFSTQRKVIFNYFTAIKNAYSDKNIWHLSTKNPFLKASGFNGAMDFLIEILIRTCADKKSFSIETIEKIINLDSNNLLLVDDIKGLDGKTARKTVKKHLERNQINSVSEFQYEF